MSPSRDLASKWVLPVALWVLILILPIATLFLLDAIGVGYTPRWDDLLGTFVNLACLGIVVIIFVAAVAALALHGFDLRIFASLFLFPIAAYSAYPYITAIEALQYTQANVSLPLTNSVSAAIPSPWSFPEHLSRATINKDFDADGIAELAVVDTYTISGSVGEKILANSIYKPVTTGFRNVFNASVQEPGYEKTCPPHEFLFASRAAIHWLNLDADNQIEIFVNQSADVSPDQCHYSGFYDWVAGQATPVYPSLPWLVERSVYPFGIPVLLLVLAKPVSTRIMLGALLAYAAWSLFEFSVSSEYTWFWTAALEPVSKPKTGMLDSRAWPGDN